MNSLAVSVTNISPLAWKVSPMLRGDGVVPPPLSPVQVHEFPGNHPKFHSKIKYTNSK